MVTDISKFKRAKQAKIRLADLDKLINQYETINFVLSGLQIKLNKWNMYKSPNMIAFKLDEVKLFLTTEKHRLLAYKKQEEALLATEK